MKNYFLICSLLLCSFLFAQRNIAPRTVPTNATIELEKGKFFVNGEQYSSFEIKNHLQNNHTEAYNYYKRSKTKSSVGGFMLGIGAGLIVGDAVKALVSDEDYPGSFTYVGAGLVAVSIPILSGRTKLMEKSIETYNQSVPKEKTLGFNFDVNVITNKNGIGLNITF